MRPSSSYAPDERLERARTLGIQVDDEDLWLLRAYLWMCHGKGYVVTFGGLMPNGGVTRLHHCIVGMPIDPDIHIDHFNRDKRDNRRSNLIYKTRSRNYLNSERSDNAEYIYKQGWSGRYYIDVTRESQRHYGGTFDTFAEAITARDELLRSL